MAKKNFNQMSATEVADEQIINEQIKYINSLVHDELRFKVQQTENGGYFLKVAERNKKRLRPYRFFVNDYERTAEQMVAYLAGVINATIAFYVCEIHKHK